MRADLLIHHLADMAGQRTSEGMDARLLDLVNDLVRPRRLAIYRLSSLGGTVHWSVRHRTSSPESTHPVHRVQDAASPELQLHRECWKSGQMLSDPMRPLVMLVPLLCDDETHCLVEIESSATLEPGQLATIKEAQRFYQQLQGLISENERDALTRLLNRKSFDQHFVQMAGAPPALLEPGPEGSQIASRRTQSVEAQRCWLAIADIDHFKRVNDSFGHLIGDEVLILVSRLLRDSFRSYDRLYRFGGEEFVVMLNTPRSELTARALERFRSTIESTAFPRVGQLTISIGFTEVWVSDTPSSAFERADECVYHAKSQGRNRIVAYDSLYKTDLTINARDKSQMEFF